MQREVELFVDHPGLKYDENVVMGMILHAIQTIGDSFPKGDLSIALLNDAKVAEIHGEFLSDPTETDVITFPGDVEMDFAGEICISVDRANAYSRENDTFFSEELTLYIVHGLLHLAGYNDKTKTQITRMRKGEQVVMQQLKSAGEIPEFQINP
jgi:probable rRNA maturation factor